jgi:hypothetical protein
VNQEAAEAIRIADKHLAAASIDRRKDLALDIHAAIIKHANIIALHVIRAACDPAAKTKPQPETENDVDR